MAVACSEKQEKKGEILLSEPKENNSPSRKDEGLALIEGADCLACHKIDSKLVGPSYQDVANKYTEADLDYLSQKIIDGGKGVWGEVPMNPHPEMQKENAQKIVKYILTLKK